MILLRRPWPAALSLLLLATTVYFPLTNSAFVIRGCGYEDYPELGFIVVIAPIALLALLLSFGGLKARWSAVALSIICFALTIMILTTGAGTGCKP